MKDKKDFIGMSKSSIVSQLHSIISSIFERKPVYDMHGLVEENKLSWFFRNLFNLGNSHYTYQNYPKPTENNGVFTIQKKADELTTIALLSDWASNTAESELVAAQCGVQDYSIHLGDTYYVGNDKEIAYNFNTDFGGTWPYGTYGSFALLGNHEMYSSGKSYFKQLLPYMGNYVVKNDKQQQASYFCLENDYWRIIGLDTGYDLLTGWLGINANSNLDLHPEQKKWLTETVNLTGDKRGLIILSHHQCFSAFEDEFPNPGKFISSLIEPDRTVLWLWGHEHWFSVYGPNKLPNGSTVFARCVGNSGMPVELNSKKKPKSPKNSDFSNLANRNLTLYDNRVREMIDKDIPLGYNGYLVLNLKENQLVIDYYDDNDKKPAPRKILQEKWEVDISTGKLTGVDITDLTENSDKKLKVFASTVRHAITP